MAFDRVLVLDWSAARGARRGADSIWTGLAAADGVAAVNHPTRAAAESALAAQIAQSLGGGGRLLIGVDFAFGYPRGFARTLTGRDGALAVWDWLGARVRDGADNDSNYRAVAAEVNGRFAGGGPFWGDGRRGITPGLPRTRPALPPGLAAGRATDAAARGPGVAPKSVWQLAGAGAVGAQSLTGLPVLNRLRRPGVAVWPFQPPDAPVVLAEIYPAMIGALVRAAQAADPGLVRDAAQVRLMAARLRDLAVTGALAPLWHPPAPAEVLADEGWILGAGAALIGG